MGNKSLILLGVLSICSINAAPSNTKNAEEVATIEETYLNEEPAIVLKADTENVNKRQKRLFDHHGYGFPPINPVIYPSYAARDQIYPGFNPYEARDPFTEIYRQVQEIATAIQQPPPQFYQPPNYYNNYPFFPVLYIPIIGCSCAPAGNVPTSQTNSSDPMSFDNRFPILDDDRRNWGIAFNNTADENNNNIDYSRPISFDPIQPTRPVNVPIPPVEHGSAQSGSSSFPADNGQNSIDDIVPKPSITVPSPPVSFANSNAVNNEFSRPISFQPVNPNPPRKPLPPVEHGTVQASQESDQGAAKAPTPTTYRPPLALPVAPQAPTPCEDAIVACCHRPLETYQCFANNGCSDTSSYGDPCAADVIARVVEKVTQFYLQRTG